MTALDAYLGRIAAEGVDQELANGLDFRAPLTVERVSNDDGLAYLQIGLDESGLGGGGSTVVESYYNPSSADLSAIAELNGVFYTVPSGQAGLYQISVTFTTPGAFAVGVDSAQVSCWLNGEPSVDSLRITPDFKLTAGGEATQVSLAASPASLLLKDGDTVHLSSYNGGTVGVLVRLELIALAADL